MDQEDPRCINSVQFCKSFLGETFAALMSS